MYVCTRAVKSGAESSTHLGMNYSSTKVAEGMTERGSNYPSDDLTDKDYMCLYTQFFLTQRFPTNA